MEEQGRAAYILSLALGALVLPLFRLRSPIYGLRIIGVVCAGFCLVLLWSGDVGSAGKGDFDRKLTPHGHASTERRRYHWPER
jgi:hypothetical protein